MRHALKCDLCNSVLRTRPTASFPNRASLLLYLLGGRTVLNGLFIPHATLDGRQNDDQFHPVPELHALYLPLEWLLDALEPLNLWKHS